MPVGGLTFEGWARLFFPSRYRGRFSKLPPTRVNTIEMIANYSYPEDFLTVVVRILFFQEIICFTQENQHSSKMPTFCRLASSSLSSSFYRERKRERGLEVQKSNIQEIGKKSQAHKPQEKICRPEVWMLSWLFSGKSMKQIFNLINGLCIYLVSIKKPNLEMPPSPPRTVLKGAWHG